MVTPPEVTGHAAGRFAELEDVFARSLVRQGGGGAALAVYVDGEPVVDLAGGSLRPTSLIQVMSVSKAVAAVAALHAHEQGLLDLDRPVADIWPQLSRPAVATITPRMVLSHSSGLPALARPLSIEALFDGTAADTLTAQDPLWKPGTRHGYGAFTFGLLLDEILRNTTGLDVADYVSKHVTGPLGADFWFGVPEGQAERLTTLEFPPPAATPRDVAAHADGSIILDGALAAIADGATEFFADSRVRAARWPSMSGVTTADSLARVFAATVAPVDGVTLLSPDTVDVLRTPHSEGWDAVLRKTNRFGLGVELPHVHLPLLGPDSFGHQGAAGSVIAVDPASRTSVAVLIDRPSGVSGASDQALVLIAAVRHCVNDLEPDLAGPSPRTTLTTVGGTS